MTFFYEQTCLWVWAGIFLETCKWFRVLSVAFVFAKSYSPNVWIDRGNISCFAEANDNHGDTQVESRFWGVSRICVSLYIGRTWRVKRFPPPLPPASPPAPRRTAPGPTAAADKLMTTWLPMIMNRMMVIWAFVISLICEMLVPAFAGTLSLIVLVRLLDDSDAWRTQGECPEISSHWNAANN